MNKNKKTETLETNPKTSLIDRRFFLKSSTSVVAAAAVVGAIPAIVNEEKTETESVVSTDSNQSTKQWKAGWMAF